MVPSLGSGVLFVGVLLWRKMASHAYVIFLRDKIKKVVPITDIKRFHVTSDFKSGQKFKVLYKNNVNDAGAYYKAYVISIGASALEAETEGEKKRFRFPVERDLMNCDLTSDFETDRDLETQVETTNISNSKLKEKKNLIQKATTSNFKSLMSATTSKFKSINAPEDSIKSSLEAAQIQIDDLTDKVASLERRNKRLTDINEELMDLNVKLQKEVIEKFEEKIVAITDTPAILPVKSKENVQFGTTTNKNVYLGHDTWLPDQVFSTLCRKKKDSLFVKDFALALFGVDVLTESSVHGRPPNRDHGEAPRTKLDPNKLLVIEESLRHRLEKRGVEKVQIEIEVAKVDKFVNEKIQDLRRKVKSRSKAQSVGKVLTYRVDDSGVLVNVIGDGGETSSTHDGINDNGGKNTGGNGSTNGGEGEKTGRLDDGDESESSDSD